MNAIFKKTHFTNRIIWILFAWFVLYQVLDSFIVLPVGSILRNMFINSSSGLVFVLEQYTPLLASCIFFVLVCLVLKKNRFLLEGVKPKKDSMKMQTHFLYARLMPVLTLLYRLLQTLRMSRRATLFLLLLTVRFFLREKSKRASSEALKASVCSADLILSALQHTTSPMQIPRAFSSSRRTASRVRISTQLSVWTIPQLSSR